MTSDLARLLVPVLLLTACGDADGTGGSEPASSGGGAPVSGSFTLDTGHDLSKLRTAPEQVPDRFENASPAIERTQQPPAFDGPPGHISIVDGEETRDFGELLQGAEVEHTWRLVSDGDDPLVVQRFKTSCGCTLAETSVVQDDGTRVPYELNQPIPPGTEFEVKAILKTQGRQGNMQTQVSIHSNDTRSVFNLKLKANVKPVLAIEPVTLNFGRITSADTVEGKMTVRTEVLEAFTLDVDRTYITEPLTVDLVPIEPDAEGKSKVWEIRAKLGPKTAEGLRNYPLVLSTDLPVAPISHEGHDHGPESPEAAAEDAQATTHQLRAYVQAQVTGMVSAQPNFVSFGMVRPGQRLTRTVTIDCHDDYELPADAAVRVAGLQEGQEFAYADAFTVTVARVPGANQLSLNVNLEGLAEDVNGSFAGSVHVQVGHPLKDELVVRFSGICRPGLPPTPSANDASAPNTAGPPTPVQGGGNGDGGR